MHSILDGFHRASDAFNHAVQSITSIERYDVDP
jgi:hypothetical protein